MKIILLVIALFLIVSCEPLIDGIEAGIIDKNVSYYEISPVMQIMYPEKDSIDMDKDSQFDIIFYKSARPLLTAFGMTTEILKKANVQIIMDADNKYPACLGYQDAINSSSKWSDSDQVLYFLQGYQCNSYFCSPVGNFTDVTDQYLAFKIGDKFGWIKLDNSVTGELTIKGYAISK